MCMNLWPSTWAVVRGLEVGSGIQVSVMVHLEGLFQRARLYAAGPCLVAVHFASLSHLEWLLADFPSLRVCPRQSDRSWNAETPRAVRLRGVA